MSALLDSGLTMSRLRFSSRVSTASTRKRSMSERVRDFEANDTESCSVRNLRVPWLLSHNCHVSPEVMDRPDKNGTNSSRYPQIVREHGISFGR